MNPFVIGAAVFQILGAVHAGWSGDTKACAAWLLLGLANIMFAQLKGN